jgi:hypothetical protein
MDGNHPLRFPPSPPRSSTGAFVANKSQTTKQSITQNILPFLNSEGEGAHKGGKTLRKNLHFTERRAEKTLLEEKNLYRFPSESAKWMEGREGFSGSLNIDGKGQWDRIGMMMMHKKCFLLSFDCLGSLAVMQSSCERWRARAMGNSYCSLNIVITASTLRLLSPFHSSQDVVKQAARS